MPFFPVIFVYQDKEGIKRDIHDLPKPVMFILVAAPSTCPSVYVIASSQCLKASHRLWNSHGCSLGEL